MAFDAIRTNAAAAYQGSAGAAAATVSVAPELAGSKTVKAEPDSPDTAGSVKVVTEEQQAQGNIPELKNTKNDAIKQAVEKVNQRTNTEAVFGIHDETNRVTIKIIDKDSKEVIKEFPPEKTLDMIAKVWKLAGVFVDEKG